MNSGAMELLLPSHFCGVRPEQPVVIEKDNVYHITHRCHDQAFLLKFSCDREDYRNRLRDTLEEVDFRALREVPMAYEPDSALKMPSKPRI
jgi:hypothetical protein